MAVGALEPKFFSRFAELLGEPDLEQLPFDSEEGRQRVAAAFSRRSQAEWAEVFAGEGRLRYAGAQPRRGGTGGRRGGAW